MECPRRAAREPGCSAINIPIHAEFKEESRGLRRFWVGIPGTIDPHPPQGNKQEAKKTFFGSEFLKRGLEQLSWADTRRGGCHLGAP